MVGAQLTLVRFKFELTFMPAESQRTSLILSQLTQGIVSNPSGEA